MNTGCRPLGTFAGGPLTGKQRSNDRYHSVYVATPHSSAHHSHGTYGIIRYVRIYVYYVYHATYTPYAPQAGRSRGPLPFCLLPADKESETARFRSIGQCLCPPPALP